MRTMAQNTRLHARKVPAQFGFIQILGDEGGRILDFSEAGLAFESFSPLGAAKTLQFWFSLNLRDRVEGTGEVVWLDSTSKVGGLRFMNLTDRAIRHIRAQYTDSFRGDADQKKHRFLAALSKQHAIRPAETTAGESYDAPFSRSPSNNIQKKSATPERLWAAVQAGDTTAAVTLAGRYLRGDGVPENCLQARVLLLVASEKKNAEAIQKLRELDKTGCPSSAPN